MAFPKSFVFCSVFLMFFLVTKADHCFPGIVPNINITSKDILQWSNALNPSKCNINAYVIDIFDWEDGSQLQYDTTADVLNYSVSFLDMCKTYSFEVHALTDKNVLGPSERINATTPAEANLNLSLAITNLTQSNHNEIHLTWNPLNLGVTRCISYYRVVYWDEDNSPKDFYVPSTNFNLTEALVPCMNYSFQVNAVVINPDEEGPLSEVNWSGYSDVTTPPKLVNIVTDKTTVNMIWSVPTYSENRCQLTSLVVNTLGLPTTTIPIQDGALRPNVDVNLKNLTPNTVYISHVSLQNSAGSSKNVTITFQTSDSFVFSYERDVIY